MRVLCGDALDVLDDLPKNSVHCVVTSPPYWEPDGDLDSYGYKNWLAEIFYLLSKVLRPEGSVWLNLGDVVPGFSWEVVYHLELDGWQIHRSYVWVKPNMSECQPPKSYEYLFRLARSGEKPYTPWTWLIQEADWFKSSVWSIDAVCYPEAEFPFNTFPPEIPKRCILASTSEKNCALCGTPRCPSHDVGTVPATVLDPFSGLGTVGLVADQLGRNYVGIEINEKYATMAVDRINRNRLARVGLNGVR